MTATLPLRLDLTAQYSDEVGDVLGPMVVQGSLFVLTLQFPSTMYGDWAGYSCDAQLREAVADEDTGTDLVLHAEVVDPVNKVVQIWATAEETQGVTARGGRWDAEIYNGTVRRRIVMGSWVLSQEVTRG